MRFGASLHERTSALLERRKNVSQMARSRAKALLRISDVGSKVITKIVRAEEGEPGDEAKI